MSREHNRRVVYGLGIPVAAAVFIAAMLWGMSRILLAVDPDVAPLVAIGFAANIVVASALAATLRGRRAFVMITAVIVATIVGGGIAGAVVGEWPVHSLVAEGDHPPGPPTEAPPTGPAPTGQPTPPPPGGEADIVAENTAFNTDRLALPADEETTLVFENRDPLTHNVAIYTEQGGDALFQGELITASTAEYEVPPLEPGSFFFQCDVHPDVMTGTVEVG
jgi:plastocyanin